MKLNQKQPFGLNDFPCRRRQKRVKERIRSFWRHFRKTLSTEFRQVDPILLRQELLHLSSPRLRAIANQAPASLIPDPIRHEFMQRQGRSNLQAFIVMLTFPGSVHK